MQTVFIIMNLILYPKFQPEDDGRVKILPRDYLKIKRLYLRIKSLRAVAKIIEVDKGTIKAIVCPEWYKKKQLKRYAKKPWLEQYQKEKGEKHNRIMREYRRKKNEVQGEEFKLFRHFERKKYAVRPLSSSKRTPRKSAS